MTAPAVQPPCLVGVGRVDLTPRGSGFPAGYSVLARRVGPLSDGEPALTATAVALIDAAGTRVVFVHADLHCAGYALWRATLERVPGLRPDELVVAATHTHLGPGWVYGAPLFDAMTGPRPWPLPSNAGWLADRLASAIHEALASCAPGGAVVVRAAVPGVASNRSLPSFRRNPPALRDAFVDAAWGAEAPPDNEADRCVDPRLTLLVVGPEGGPARAALAWFACHGTALGAEWPRWSAEWAGVARAAFEAEGGPLLGIASGATGDTSPLPLDADGRPRADGGSRPSTQGAALADAVGGAVARAARAAVAGARPTSFTLAVAHEVWRPSDDGLTARYGLATLGGAIDGAKPGAWERGHLGVDAPGYAVACAFPEGHPHHPKLDATRDLLGGIAGVGGVVGALAPDRIPLHVVRLGGHVLATVPGEPTTLGAFLVERAVRDAAGAATATVSGYSGTYAGYWATPDEYDQQRYEGASTLFGREATPRLAARLAALGARVAAEEPR
jgi:neutral ceramidase